MSNRILILGKGGQVSRALAGILQDRAPNVSTKDVDFSSPDFIKQLSAFVGEQAFSAVINAAAYTQVDKAESEQEKAFRINAEAVGELAVWCREHTLPLVHFSSDYVFDGSGEKPRREDASVAPLNAYGQSKLAGEQAVQKAGGDYLIFRTSWIYDAEGANFFNTMQRLFKEQDTLNVVIDQVGAPTYAPHLARAVLKGLGKAQEMQPFPSGIYHLCGGGETSWFEFAKMILALARTHDSGIRCERINPIASSAYPTPAKRPLNSRLDCSKAMDILGAALPGWQAGLAECIEEKYGRTEFTHQGTEDHPAERAGG